ncbi:proteasome activator [Brevibacterium samyangense]|uniref:Bacterial proteasome activator n=1 Tax=Brevibacterium samyangense TaxID=366888 RepID=A0ABN2T613_9MICO
MSENTPLEPTLPDEAEEHAPSAEAPTRHDLVAGVPGAGPAGAADSEDEEPAVSEPGKLLRLGTMAKQLLEEVRQTELDEGGRERLAEIHRRSVEELAEGMSRELADELRGLALPFDEDEVPSTGELRIAQAQLVGWLEGLFHGIQTAIMAQQAMGRQGARGALPPGMVVVDPQSGQAHPPQGALHPGQTPGEDSGHRPGNYL